LENIEAKDFLSDSRLNLKELKHIEKFFKSVPENYQFVENHLFNKYPLLENVFFGST
jgi:hypothetical protein